VHCLQKSNANYKASECYRNYRKGTEMYLNNERVILILQALEEKFEKEPSNKELEQQVENWSYLVRSSTQVEVVSRQELKRRTG
jgi:hypothetical protein